MSALVTVKGLDKRIGRKKVLQKLDFTLEPGKVVGLLGPNGAGKTTLIKLLAGHYHPDAGSIEICGKRVGVETKALVSYMPDSSPLFGWMRVKETIQCYADLFGDFDRARATELCTAMGIDEADTIRSLSKGMTERVMIMLTFARKARLYLLDEPIGGIDPLARSSIIKTLFSALDEDSTILLSTHQVKDVETLLDEVLFLQEGMLVFADSADGIRENRNQSIEECYLEVMRFA